MILLALFAGSCAVQAQTSGSIGLVSENTTRGYALSDGHPALQLRLEHDAASGWYGGGFVSTVSIPATDTHAQLIAYGGYAHRLASGVNWEVGASRTVFTGHGGFDYTEAYAGFAWDRSGARIYLSPSYYGGARTAYAELNVFHPLGERLRLVGHAGVLHRFGAVYGARRRIDLRLGLGADLGQVSLQLAWLARQRDPAGGPRRARALAASATYAF